MTNPAKIPATASLLTADEIRDGLWFIDIMLKGGTSEAEADVWRREILARQAFLGLDDVAQG